MSESKNYRLEIDREKCISAASCVALAPKTLELDIHNIPVVKDPDGDADEDKLLAAQSCPVGAIKVINLKRKKQVWPK